MSCTKLKPFTTQDIPDMSGKTVLVTGATGGLGLHTAMALAVSGATVLVGGRNAEKGKAALEKIKAAAPKANVTFAMIDHGSLASVKAFAEEFNSRNQALDILINNAGIMAPPSRGVTSDNFEIQMGTNHFSHFALTAGLLPSLKRATSPRVVNVSSIAAKDGKMNLKDLNWTLSYSPWASYQQSKLANLLFSFELQRRSEQKNWGVSSIAAHPGVSMSDLIDNGPGSGSFMGKIMKWTRPLTTQPVERGMLPSLFAAVSPEATGGGYYGPNGFMELKGDVTKAFVPTQAKDEEMAKKLWEESEKLTGVVWDN